MTVYVVTYYDLTNAGLDAAQPVAVARTFEQAQAFLIESVKTFVDEVREDYDEALFDAAVAIVDRTEALKLEDAVPDVNGLREWCVVDEEVDEAAWVIRETREVGT